MWGSLVSWQGGATRPGMPAPRRVRRKPYIQLRPPTVWTTLKLTLHADGTSEGEMTGATPLADPAPYRAERFM